MRAINIVTGSLLDALLWPFQAWPLAGLTVVSLLVALALLAAFKRTSNQRALVAAKRQVQASLFELRLFQDDPRAVLRAVADLLRHQARYLRYASVPLLWIGLPLALLVTQLQARYGYDGLRPGQSAIVTVRMKAPPAEDAADTSPAAAAAAAARRMPRPPLALAAPDGLRVETPGVWAAALRETAWRIAAVREGEYDLRVSWNGAEVAKRIRVGRSIAARAPVRPAATVWAQFQHPAEAPLPADSRIEAIEVSYPTRYLDVAGVPLHWIVIFVGLSMVFALIFRPRFAVVL